MKFQVDHDYHIHSQLSICSDDPEQTKERILQYAKENKLKKICITDHYWDSLVPTDCGFYLGKPQNFEYISQIRPLPQEDGIEFLFGCETDFDWTMTIGIPKSRFRDFDFVIIPTTHLHMVGFTMTEEYNSNEGRAKIWVMKLDALFAMDLPFYKIGLAHLACPLINCSSRENYLKTLDLIPTDEMKRLFTKAAKLGVGIELNQDDMKFSDAEADTVLRMFRIAKSCGCKFYLGSDAHHPASLDSAVAIFERAINYLELTEEDKFDIVK